MSRVLRTTAYDQPWTSTCHWSTVFPGIPTEHTKHHHKPSIYLKPTCFTMFHHVSPCFTMFHHVSPCRTISFFPFFGAFQSTGDPFANRSRSPVGNFNDPRGDQPPRPPGWPVSAGWPDPGHPGSERWWFRTVEHSNRVGKCLYSNGEMVI